MPRSQSPSSKATGVKTPTSYPSKPTAPMFQSPLGPIMPRHQTPIHPPPTSHVTTSLTPQTIQIQNKTSMWENVKGGFGFGVGSSIASRMFGPSYPTPQTPLTPQNPQVQIQCEKEQKDYSECIKNNKSCEEQLNSFNKCLSR